MNKLILPLIFFSLPLTAVSQVTLDADGPGNTYELINSKFAPGNDAVENPECVHPDFGRHITEVWDADLNRFVFEFYSHVTPDNDRCINFDRQRIEIKTYEPSPDNLKGVAGETVAYKWKFKLPAGFQPSSSFTHIHQIKAVGGDDGNPIFTLTPRKGSPSKMELIHNNTTKVVTVNLSTFEGIWVECTEVIKIGANGTYSMMIKKVSDGTILLSYENRSIMTIRPDNVFIRPKWGIYRSLDHPTDLRDEAMRFASFSIQEGATDVSQSDASTPSRIMLEQNYPNPFNPSTTIRFHLAVSSHVRVEISDHTGRVIELLIDRTAEAGQHQIGWNAARYASGLFFCTLRSNGFSETRKLLLLK